jgi:pimeloyl-ACP methyl ester carboxylesterase
MSPYEFLERGQGTPLLMLHGMMGWPANWEGTFPYLPPDCRVLALRLPFFEDAVRLDSVEAITEYVQGFLDAQGLERLVICGNSLGGHAALVLALRHPQRVAGIVLTGSSGLFERGFAATQGSRPSREWIQDRIREIFFDPALATDELIDEVQRLIYIRRNARDIVHIAKSAKRDNMADRLGQIACPALVLWGRQDVITPPEVAQEFKDELPNAELVWIEQCGHAAMMEHPREFGQALADWWNRHISGK